METIYKIPEPDLPTSPSSSFSSPLSTPSLPHPPIPTAALTATPASPSLFEDGERRGGERGEREDREVEETSVASAQSPQRTTKASIISTSTSSSSSSSTTTTSNSTTSNSNSPLTIEDSSTSQHTLLSVAISQGHKAMAEWLVESGAPLSSSTPRSDPLLTAIRRGDVAAVEMLLDAFVARDLPVPVALFFHDPITEEPAAATEVILALVEHPSFVENLHSIVSRSPSRIVLSAVKRGSLRLMQRLFAHPLITPTSVSFSGVLARAVRLRCHDIVQHLLSLGAPLPVTDSLLCAAVRNDDAAMARLILGEQGPQQPNANAASVLSVPNGPGSAIISNASGTARLPTPLSLACEHRCSAEMFTLLLSICKDSPPPPSLLHAAIKAGCGTEVVLLLINHGAPFDTAPYPLLTASEAGSFETVRILLGAGADPVRCNLIHTAAGAGQVELVRLLIERGCPCDVPAADHTTPLYKAVLKGNCEVVKLLVEAGASRGFVMNGGFSLMYAAAEFGYLEIVELLFSLGCAFDLPNSIDGATPLYMAAQNGHLEIAKRLIEAGANTQVLFKESHSLLYVAAEHGRTKMIRYLLGAPGNADPNRASQDGSTPLYAAVKSRHPKVVRILIEAGADINHLNASGLSPIFVAAERGFTELVKLLLEKGASGFDVPNVVDGATPLYVAVLNGHLEVVELLVKAGASLTVVQTSSGFDLVFAAADANHNQLLRYLLSLGCSPNTVARNSYTPLYAAVKKHLWEVAEILLDGGANPNYSLPSSGFTPMYIAAEIGRTKFVRKLLGVGAEADLPNTIDQATPVYIAAQNGHLKIVKLLLAAGANQNITLRGGYNMVYVSAQFGRSDVCEHLVELGVPFDHPCEVSSTPLYMAVRNGHLSIAEFLLDKGANKNVIHRDGFSLMYLACERGYYSFAKRLLRLGALYDVPNLKDGATPLYMATQHGY
ncbi:MAG: ankyrin repeat domain-containing protein, partial [archaeon]|nr:ankyrin repeat domain-containing protein [archaeon]